MIKILAIALGLMLATAPAWARTGIASYYGGRDGLCGHRTANGGRLNCRAMTAAHKTLPFGTKVRVTNRRNGASTIVTINDRGPFVRGRVLDLSIGAARAIGIIGRGIGHIEYEVLKGF